MSDLTISDAYKIGFQDGLSAGKNKAEAVWIKKKRWVICYNQKVGGETWKTTISQ